MRIAKVDIDTNPSVEYANELLDWMCKTLNDSAARIAELESEVKMLHKAIEASENDKKQWRRDAQELDSDARIMAEGLIETHWPGRYTIACEDCHRRKVLFAKTCTELECKEAQLCVCPACLIAAKYREVSND